MLNSLTQKARYLRLLVNENSTTILTGVGVAGVGTTAYLTGRATFKAARLLQEEEAWRANENSSKELTKFQKIKVIWRLYIPPFGVAVTTIAAILVANKIASKKIAALTIASGISERALQEYKEKVVQKFGEGKSRDVRDEIAQDRVNQHPIGSREVILAGTGEVLCFDMTTGRYFQSTVEEIRRAENKINHQLIHFMSASLSEFYDEIGLPPTSYSDEVGWNMNNHMEIQMSAVMSPDNRPCMAIDFSPMPIAEYNKNVY